MAQSDLLEALHVAMRESLQKGVPDEAFEQIRKKLRDMADEMFSIIEDRVREDLAPVLSGFVKDNSAKVIKALLEGNEAEMRRYIGCREGWWNDRSDGDSGWGRKREIWEWHSVIHGKMFEHGYVVLRRQIVEAHRDLLTSERIKDLEDQVASLVAQVNREKATRELAEQRARDYSR